MRAGIPASFLALCSCVTATQRRVSVSGQSAGGSMAVQHLVAFSSSVDGAGIAAGSPYGCGGTMWGRNGRNVCSYGPLGPRRKKELNEYVQKHFQWGLIDDPSFLKKIPAVLFLGKDDSMVYPKIMHALGDQLAEYTAPDMITSVYNTTGAHIWPRDHGRCKCGSCEWFWGEYRDEEYQYDHDPGSNCCDVNDCGYDFTGDVLRKTYGHIKPRVAARKGQPLPKTKNGHPSDDLWWIDQSKYVPKKTKDDVWEQVGMTKWGLVYVPTGCKKNPSKCKVHVSYHGCMTPINWKPRVQLASLLDLNQYGEANDIIVLYPQATTMPKDNWGCWNWAWKKDDPLFDTHHSVQLRTVLAMVEGLNNAITSGELLTTAPPPDAELGLEEFWQFGELSNNSNISVQH